MAEIPDLPRDEVWVFRSDIPDDLWNKAQAMVPQVTGPDGTQATLSVGIGGSIVLPDIVTLQWPTEVWENAYANREANYDNYWNAARKADPMKFSKTKYHGYIKNLDTQEIRKFQFNPEKFEYARSVTYTDSVSPGMAYPETQFSHGNAREFDIELFMYDPYCTGLIKEYMYFLGAFLTPETNAPGYSKPPELLFYYGYFIRRCVLTNLNIVHEWLDGQGTPLMSRYQLTLRQVGVDEL